MVFQALFTRKNVKLYSISCIKVCNKISTGTMSAKGLNYSNIHFYFTWKYQIGFIRMLAHWKLYEEKPNISYKIWGKSWTCACHLRDFSRFPECSLFLALVLGYMIRNLRQFISKFTSLFIGDMSISSTDVTRRVVEIFRFDYSAINTDYIHYTLSTQIRYTIGGNAFFYIPRIPNIAWNIGFRKRKPLSLRNV